MIELPEESRRDNPLIRNRVDQEPEVMAQPVDPQSVLAAIKGTARDGPPLKRAEDSAQF